MDWTATIQKFIEELASPALIMSFFVIGVLCFVLWKIIESQSKKDILLSDLTREVEKANTTNATLTQTIREFFEKLKEARG